MYLFHFSQLQILLVNVRGLDERWEEILLLHEKYKLDYLTIIAVGAIELSLVKQIFVNFKYFYQKGENPLGSVIMLFKTGLLVMCVKYKTPNICIVDAKPEQTIRLVGIYAPKCKTLS